VRVARLEKLELAKVPARARWKRGPASARTDVDAPIAKHDGSVAPDESECVEDVSELPRRQSGDRCAFGAHAPRRQIADHAGRG